MATLISTVEVEDYDTWRAVFDDMAGARGQRGLGAGRVFRDRDHPNTITVVLDGDAEGMRAYGQSQELKDALASAGVIRQTEMRIVDDVT